MSENEEMKQEEVKEQPSKYPELIKQCRLLYRQAKLSMMETCMCWGICCGEGWYEPIKELSYRLECLNYVILPKWGFVIEAEQVKEKYGTLRFYFTVREVPPLWRRVLAAPFMWLGITKVEAKGLEKKVADGIAHFFFTIGNRILSGSKRRRTRRNIIRSAIDTYVEKLVQECDEACFNVCEYCGTSFAWTPRCETLGWISYICPECAKKGHHHYRYVLTDKEKSNIQKSGSPKAKEILANLDKELDEDGKPYVAPKKKVAMVAKAEEAPKKPAKPRKAPAKKSTKKEAK